MGAKDYIGSLFLKELLKGMALTGRYFFQRKITIYFPEEKTPQSNRFRGLHALRRYPNGGSAVSPVSCARPCARRWRLRSSLSSATTVRAGRVATTLT